MPTTTQAKTYTIGQVAAMFNLSTYTLRYYDKEGLIPNLKKRRSGKPGLLGRKSRHHQHHRMY